MSASEILPAPEIKLPVPSKFERERWEFYKQLSELLKTHEGEYVAIHDGRVVGHGADQSEVALDAYKRFGYVPIYVGHVTSEPPRPARIPSPRLVQAPGAWNGPISVQYSD